MTISEQFRPKTSLCQILTLYALPLLCTRTQKVLNFTPLGLGEHCVAVKPNCCSMNFTTIEAGMNCHERQEKCHIQNQTLLKQLTMLGTFQCVFTKHILFQSYITILIPPLAQITCPVHHALSGVHSIPTIPPISSG